MKLSDLRSTLGEIGVAPVKTLGQNFLHDQNLRRWIIDHAELTKNDLTVEIGPGLGALTEFALERAARVLAIEKDARLVEFLRQRFRGGAIEIVHCDALDFDVRTLFAEASVKLIGNLPYNIATPLMLKYLEYPSPISHWLLMLQKEMAQRLSAHPSTKDYGALTLQIQFHYHVEYLRTVPATVFFPEPDVDSALVAITPRAPGEVPHCDYEFFMQLVRAGFSQRRKQLGKLIRDHVPDWNATATALGLDPKTRAEALSLEQWVGLTNYLRPLPRTDPREANAEWFPVVDANDIVLHSAHRREVHGNNLRHRAIHILLFNGAGEVFLQKRSRTKDRHPLVWDSSAAGHVNAGEGYDATAIRELEEELGVTGVHLDRLAKLPASPRTGWEFIWLYTGRHEGPFNLSREEIETGKFFPAEIVTQWLAGRPGDFAPGFVECWRVYRAGPGNG